MKQLQLQLQLSLSVSRWSVEHLEEVFIGLETNDLVPAPFELLVSQ